MKHKQSIMEKIVSCVAFALLFLAHIIPSEAESQVSALYTIDDYVIFDLKLPFVLKCNVTLDPPADYTLEWLKDDKQIENGGRHMMKKDEKESIDKLIISESSVDDVGNYTCRVVNNTMLSATIQAVARPVVKINENYNVVDGEKLRINCKVFGRPTPTIEWVVGNRTYNTSDGRIQLGDNDDKVANASLIISPANMSDRGNITCRGRNVGNASEAVAFLRVKDKLAALWPFLGICAEVFVLCAIILVYEKRRSKPELDESDTDQSPDTKKS